jgi:hypothetical protein
MAMSHVTQPASHVWPAGYRLEILDLNKGSKLLCNGSTCLPEYMGHNPQDHNTNLHNSVNLVSHSSLCI